jgi:diguanylate cyclase (GGDEF)-like protein
MRVLIADDEPGTRLLVSTAVERLGHACAQAEDGDEAWRLFQEHSPDVVITDWEMPGLNGTALAERIRGQAGSRYTYVLVITARADEEAARRTMQAGADDFVVKPLEAAELERKLIAAERVTSLHNRMHDDARLDALTGLGNRHRLAEDLTDLCGRVERYAHSYCVALFDIDSFKAVNDSEGHQAGDTVLRAVASALAEQIRTGDTLYRYGGEEFVVLLPEQTLDSAVQAAERLRTAVERLRLPHPGGGVVTISGGVAGLGATQSSPEELLEQADQALYRAKERGRNRVEVAPAEDSERPIRLLIADDDAGVRTTIAAVAGREPTLELIGEAEDAEQAIELAERRRPDVVVLDLAMPGGGGVRAAQEILERLPDARVVALSADDSQAAMYDMTRAGAVGYVVKGAPPDELVRVIQSAARW